MTIRFSRHARRRMQLYKISDTVVTEDNILTVVTVYPFKKGNQK